MGNKIKTHFAVFLLGALWVLLLPPLWGLGALFAATIHELCHLMAVLLCGGQVLEFSIEPLGARMRITPLSPGSEALCALAGPAGSFCLLLLAERFPEAALCGLIQGGYNLLPIYPLDGGRFLGCLFSASVCRSVEVFVLVLVSGIGLWICICSREVGLLFLLSLWIPVIQRKLSCKDS